MDQGHLPSSNQYFPPVFFVLFCFLNVPVKSQSLHYRCPVRSVRALSWFAPAASTAPFLQEPATPRAAPRNPRPRWLGTPPARACHPLLAPGLRDSGLVLTPSSAVSFLIWVSSNMGIIRTKRDEMCTSPATETCLHPELGIQLLSANRGVTACH